MEGSEQMMLERMHWLRDELGFAGLASLALVGLALLFLHWTVGPLEQRSDELRREVARSEALVASPDRNAALAATPAARLAAFYAFFDTEEQATDWLAKLEAIAKGVGMTLPSADYRMHKTGTGIERYEITLPLSGSYAQIRAFVENALNQVPVLSLDHIRFRRERASDSAVQADVRLTLHLVKKP
jgi:hypothetical protein